MNSCGTLIRFSYSVADKQRKDAALLAHIDHAYRLYNR